MNRISASLDAHGPSTALGASGVRQRVGLQPSRAAVVRLLLVVAVGVYVAATVTLLVLIERVGGAAVWLARGVVVFGASFAAMTLLPPGRARSWLRLQVAKHMFSHRYDYRVAWLQLTRALAPDPERSLAERIPAALGQFVDAPAALLLVPGADGTLAPAGPAPWPIAVEPIGAAFVRLLERAPRILDCDALRQPTASAAATEEERALAPHWIVADRSVWAGVPLVHGERLTGLVLLARPRADRRLDWEDHDLLAAAGRQVASHLAEAQGQEALGEARRFHEFNRRFAFIVHDIKNLASGLGLVARNAERHADNPAFRADMVTTLRESVERLNDLLARLTPHNAGRADPPVPTQPIVVLEALAARLRAQHPIRLTGAADLWALIDPARFGLALGHLVQNAIEASAPGEPVWLGVERRGGEVAITVLDRGRGMTTAYLRDGLFVPFRSTKAGGFGIGAYEARTLIAAMGGRLEVESHEGEGTRFTIFVPTAEPLRLTA